MLFATEKVNYSTSSTACCSPHYHHYFKINCKSRINGLFLLCFFVKHLDYESKKAYTFKVDATNAHLDPRFQSFGAFKDTATVKINVLDVDEPPVFNKPSYVMDVYEDTPAGTIIGAVTAQDLDASGSPVRWS